MEALLEEVPTLETPGQAHHHKLLNGVTLQNPCFQLMLLEVVKAMNIIVNLNLLPIRCIIIPEQLRITLESQ